MSGEVPPTADDSLAPEPGTEEWARLLPPIRPQLRALHRTEVVAAVAGGVTHEFNNLLLAIRGYVGLLLMSETLDQASRLRLEQIETAAPRATDLNRRFQILGRSAEGRPALIDFNDAAREAAGLARLGWGRKATFTFHSRTGPLPVVLGFTPARRTLLFLSFNAAEAIPEGGTVTVTTEALPPGAGEDHVVLPAGIPLLR